MKHIAIRSKSVRAFKPYTTPGLGDRAHHVLKAHLYGVAHNTDVTLHLTKDKYGKQHKKVSWKELTEMVPNVSIEVHPVADLDEDEWLHYLAEKNIHAELYHYKDTMHMHPYEEAIGIEMSQYFKKLPCLEPPNIKQNLPRKFITAQFDSTDAGRNSNIIQIEGLLNKFRVNGTQVVHIGGDAKTEELRESLHHIAHAIYHADAHVGVDSGMMHVAQFYKDWKDIHILRGSFTSHHLIRAKNNGASIYDNFKMSS